MVKNNRNLRKTRDTSRVEGTVANSAGRSPIIQPGIQVESSNGWRQCPEQVRTTTHKGHIHELERIPVA